MARYFEDMVKELSYTEGTGPLTTAGTPEGSWLTFAGMPVGDTAPVNVRGVETDQWEITEVTRLPDGRLARAATPYSSSANGDLVDFGPGPKEVFIAPVARDVLEVFAARAQTAADREQTGQDRLATGQDREATATHAEQTDGDAQAVETARAQVEELAPPVIEAMPLLVQVPGLATQVANDTQTTVTKAGEAAGSALSAAGSAQAAAASVPLAADRTVGYRLNDFSNFSVIRGTSTWDVDAAGNLTEIPPDTVAWGYDPATLTPRGAQFQGQRANRNRNSRVEGPVAGTPGNFPLFWSFNANGMSRQVMGDGYIGNLHYVDIRFYMTATTATSSTITFDTNTTPARPGQRYSSSLYLALVNGTLNGISGILDRISVGGGTGTAQTSVGTLTSTLRRIRVNTTAALGAGASTVQHNLTIGRSSGDIDFTLRIAAPQLEEGPFASLPILPPLGSPRLQARSATTSDALISDFGSRWNRRQGTIIIDWVSQPGAFSSSDDADWMALFSWGDRTTANRMGLLVNPAHTSVEARVTAGGVIRPSSACSMAPPTEGYPLRSAISYSLDGNALQAATRSSSGVTVGPKVALPALPSGDWYMDARFGSTNPGFLWIAGREVRPVGIFDSSLGGLL